MPFKASGQRRRLLLLLLVVSGHSRALLTGACLQHIRQPNMTQLIAQAGKHVRNLKGRTQQLALGQSALLMP
jgi:hypothetical protein